tara:strand:- start:93 stop:311 length:219 start_codon:yes stop_codon:yes gene_type:complete
MKKNGIKLSLNKETISKLNDNELNSLNGGADSHFTIGLRCILHPKPKPSAACGQFSGDDAFCPPGLPDSIGC